MRPTNFLRTTAFRMALGYLALFALSSLALLAFLFWTTAGLVARQTDETIEAEITGLAEQYRRTGTGGLRAIVQERSRNQRASLYLLTTPTGLPLAGNLGAWPPVPTQRGGWLDFAFERPVGATVETHQARARHLRLPGGFQLLVGRDVEERFAIGRRIRQSLAWALGLTLVLGLAGGVLMSRNMLRRIDAISRTSREIMAGDLSRRVPVSGSGDELDRLAGQLNEMLAQIERLMTGLRQVTDNVAHDLRSPLSRLRSRLELALLEAPTVDGYRAALESGIAESERLIGTFNELLKIARAESGSEKAEMAPVEMATLLGDVAELYDPVAEDKSVTLAVHAPAATIHGNQALLSQALANLVDNAVKYTPVGGRVSLSAHPGPDGTEIVVADSGPGIPEAARRRVLERFVRLDDSRSTPGSGLGLSLVAAVAQLHGATLLLEDNAPGLRVTLRFAATPPTRPKSAG